VEEGIIVGPQMLKKEESGRQLETSAETFWAKKERKITVKFCTK
jgi:hypothetical protein